MTSINVPAGWINAGTLPPCCARHGGPVTEWQKRSFYTPVPWWLLILFPFAMLLAAIIALCIRRTVKGVLPACAECKRDRQRFVRLAIGGWVLDAALLFVFTLLGPAGIVLWLVTTFAALCFCFCGDRFRVSGRVSKDTMWVQLRGVDASFASAIKGALAPPSQFVPPAPVAATPPVLSEAPVLASAPLGPSAPLVPSAPEPAVAPIGQLPSAPAAMTILPGR